MARFARLGPGNIVETVVLVSNDIATTEQAGVDFLNNLYKTNDVWKQTSYNTFLGKHWTYTKDENGNDIRVESADQSKAFRKNHAAIGYRYDQARDAFIPPRTYDSWVFNEETCGWDSPVARPDDGQKYLWNETTKQWDLINE